MKKIKFSLALIIFLTSLLFWVACGDKEVVEIASTTEYLIVGTYYGFCIGDCVNLFQIVDNQVFGDAVNDNVIPENVPFKNDALGGDSYELAKVLVTGFPDELGLVEADSQGRNVLGCPDCADQGGFYLELKKVDEETAQKWYVDTNEKDLPDYLVDYVRQIRSVMEAL